MARRFTRNRTAKTTVSGILLAVVIPAILYWVFTGGKGPATGSIEWYVENPSRAHAQIENCTPNKTPDGKYLQTADAIQFPHLCESARQALDIIKSKK